MPVPNQVKADLKVAGRVVLAAAKGLPIVARPSEPPLNFIRITSMQLGPAGPQWMAEEKQTLDQATEG